MSISSWQLVRNNIKSSLSCIDYLHSLGFPVSKSGQCINAPSFIRPSDSHPSFAVYDDHCFDFATNTPYDIIDLEALAHFNGDKTKALESLYGQPLPKSHSDITSDYQSQAAQFAQRVDYWHSQLLLNPLVSPSGTTMHILDYLSHRGFNHDAVINLKLGFSPKMNKLMIPFFNRHNQPVYVAGRDMSGKSSEHSHSVPKYWYIKLDDEKFSDILDKCIFGINSLRPGFVQPDTVYDHELGKVVNLSSHHIKYDFLAVCEGMLDVLSFRAEGWSAVTGKISQKQEREFLDICRQYRDKDQKIFVCFDSDKAGQDYQFKICRLLFKHGIPFVAGHLPKSFTVSRQDRKDFGHDIIIKDVNDYYAAGGSLDTLVRSAIDGMQEIARTCKDEDELQQLFLQGGRVWSHWDLKKLKSAASSIMIQTGKMIEKITKDGVKEVPEIVHKFDTQNVNFMFGEAMRPMQDCDIAKAVTEKHQLIYDTLGQFYEYRRGVWKAMNELLIQQEIIRAMHGNISQGKTSAVCKYLKADLADNVQFNTKHNVVFQNGTLWLDEDGSQVYDDPDNPLHGMPKNFKKSSPEDMSTIQVSYNYNPNARNTVLERAAREWTNRPDGAPDPEKYRLLKQMFGYILFVKNTLQKFFILKGDGANGKSTCMHCIEAILGKENTTSLQISRLGSEFDPVVLKHSRVNLCYDAQSSIENAQEVLKAIIGGDSITAAHKGVDAESFTTNAKFIVSANKFFSANDVSRGLLRRMLFIAFNNTFEPQTGQTPLEDEIMQDLPGLFNFAYEGYKDLMTSGYFCDTDEQAALLEEFREQLSPVILFAREELYPIEDSVLNDKVVYSMYSQWCKNNGEKALGRTKFIPEIRQVIRTDGNIIPDPVRDKETKEWLFTFPARIPETNSEIESRTFIEKNVPSQSDSDQETQEKILAHSDRQNVQEVSKSHEEQKSAQPEKPASAHTADLPAKQAGQEGQNRTAQEVSARESVSALQRVASTETQTQPSANQQGYIDGFRVHIPDPARDGFPYDESKAWGLFRWLKRFGRGWKNKLSGVFQYKYGLDDDHSIECRITEEELLNMGIYLRKNPILKACLPGIDEIFAF